MPRRTKAAHNLYTFPYSCCNVSSLSPCLLYSYCFNCPVCCFFFFFFLSPPPSSRIAAEQSSRLAKYRSLRWKPGLFKQSPVSQAEVRLCIQRTAWCPFHHCSAKCMPVCLLCFIVHSCLHISFSVFLINDCVFNRHALWSHFQTLAACSVMEAPFCN